MIESLVLFIPAIICLIIGACGLFCVGISFIGLRRGRSCREATPPKLGDAGKPQGVGNFFWKLFMAAGVGQLLVALIGLWAAGLSVSRTQQPTRQWSDHQSPALEALVRKRCLRFVERGKTVGLAVAVVRSNETCVVAFGRQALGGKAANGNTLFELGSITKTFTALTLAREIDRGNLRLEQPVQELLPPGVNLPTEARGITLKNLTTHTSGFPRLPANMSGLRGVGMFFFGADPYGGYEETRMLNAIRTVKLQSQPGTESSYSNFGMMLLGYLLARRAGTNLEALVQGQICEPLGMRETCMRVNPLRAGQTAQGYRALIKAGPLLIGLQSAPWFKSGDLGGAGALRSSADDMLKYLQANMAPGGPLKSAIEESHHELFQENKQSAFAMNWIRSKWPAFEDVVIWHNGGTGGFRSFLGFTEGGQVGVVVLSNSTGSVDGLGTALLRELDKN